MSPDQRYSGCNHRSPSAINHRSFSQVTNTSPNIASTCCVPKILSDIVQVSFGEKITHKEEETVKQLNNHSKRSQVLILQHTVTMKLEERSSYHCLSTVTTSSLSDRLAMIHDELQQKLIRNTNTSKTRKMNSENNEKKKL
jgi:hypothetical protein